SRGIPTIAELLCASSIRIQNVETREPYLPSAVGSGRYSGSVPCAMDERYDATSRNLFGFVVRFLLKTTFTEHTRFVVWIGKSKRPLRSVPLHLSSGLSARERLRGAAVVFFHFRAKLVWFFSQISLFSYPVTTKLAMRETRGNRGLVLE